MTRLALRSLLSRPLRTALTTLAILLGVAMISGTYVLTDQITNGFDDIFTAAYEGTAVSVTPRDAVEGFQNDASALAMPERLVDDVQAVDGVATAQGSAEALGAVVVDGEVVDTGGAPTLVLSADDSASQVTWVEGGAPSRSGDVAVNRGFAEAKALGIGDEIGLVTDEGEVPVRIRGVFDFGDAASLGGTVMVAAPLADVQAWYGLEGKVSAISATAAPGVAPQELADRVRAALPDSVEVRTGEQAAADASTDASESINTFLRPALLAFGGVAIFVGAFIIFNAFSITVAQRLREFAMLRSFGASRRQVLASVFAEALLMGVAASVAGLFAGLGVAMAINQLFKLVGADIPVAGIGLETRTVVVALAVGIGTAVAAAVVPAVRATRIPPVAALQEGATLPPSRLNRMATPAAGVVAGLGVALVAVGFFADLSATTMLLALGGGAMLLFIAVAMVSRHIVRPLARVVGWPLERLAGTPGRLARENAGRNPARTANTAAALMIGLGLVVFVAVFAQGLKSSFLDVFGRSVKADVVAMYTGGSQNVPEAAVTAMKATPGVETVSSVVFGQVKTGAGQTTFFNAIEPETWPAVWQLDWRGDADNGLLAALDGDGVVVDDQTAKRRGWEVGDAFEMTSPAGRTAEVRVLGVYRDAFLMSGVTMSQELCERLGIPMEPSLAMATGVPGADDDEVKAAVEAALADFPTQSVYTQRGYEELVNGQINQLLMMLYALLAMSVTISAFGIVNTLVLSVYERTREIGMLRAIGTSRRQMRRIVRYESVITSVIGGLLGTAVGVAFAYAVTTRYADQGFAFAVPFAQLGVFLVVAVAVGVLAAVLPARRAARIDVLEAIHHE